MSFDESDHPRAGDGRFAPKPCQDSDASLDAPMSAADGGRIVRDGGCWRHA